MSDHSALFGGLNEGPIISELAIGDIRPDPQQPRKHFNEDELRELADSIEVHGLVQPIVVRKDPERHGSYLITAGERRWRAVRLLERPSIEAIVRDQENAAVVAIVENLQRVDLSPIEEAEAVARLIDEQSLSQEAAGRLLGKNRLTINQLLKINGLPAAIRADAVGRDVSKSILIELALLPSEDTQHRLWKRAVAGNLTVSEIRRVKKEKPAQQSRKKDDDEAPDVRRLTPAQRALDLINKGVRNLQAQELSEEERTQALELINRLNALTVIADVRSDSEDS